MQVVPVSGLLSLKQVANITGASFPGVDNITAGGDLNAFVDACVSVLGSAEEQGVSLKLAGRNVVSWYRDPNRDPNPIEPGAEGAPMGDRIYAETDDGWFFGTWSGVWYLIPFGETPQDRPCDSPLYTGCRRGESVDLMPGTVPGNMLWRPAENPDMNPHGELFAEEDAPESTSTSSSSSSSSEEAGISTPVALMLAGAAALFFFD